MDLPQPLYRAHFDLMAQSAFKQLVCLLLTLFIDGYHPLQPLVEYARSFIRDDGNDGVYPPPHPQRQSDTFPSFAIKPSCRQIVDNWDCDVRSHSKRNGNFCSF